MQFYQCITDFIFAEDEPRQADIIFVPGGSYPDAAVHAAELYRGGYAPLVMPSGKYSILTGHFVMPGQTAASGIQPYAGEIGVRGGEPAAEGAAASGAPQHAGKIGVRGGGSAAEKAAASGTPLFRTECEYLCDVLLRHGVPDAAIIREDRATFTYENAIYSRRRLQELGLRIRRAILSCQAFHARRCLMYYQEQFPETEFLVCPVVTKGISRENWHRTRAGIDTVLGELERCGGQFHEILYEKLQQENPASEEAVRETRPGAAALEAGRPENTDGRDGRRGTGHD